MQTKITEAEHSPSPQPARGIYGFVLGSFCAFIIVSYAIWMLLPAEVIKTWPYQPPQKYWASAVPTILCTALFLFVFCIYPSLHQLHDGELDEPSAFTDRHSISDEEATLSIRLSRKQRQNTLRGLSLKLNHRGDDAGDRKVNELREIPIPAAADMKLEDVCSVLYLNDSDED